jgi:hypothetical protein
MADLTVLYYTANVIREPFGELVRQKLLDAIGDLPLIDVSQRPLPGFGENICVGDIGQKYINIYRQQLIGVRAVRTQYVALAEDDILYPPSHFTCWRPPADAIGYDMHKWAWFTWQPACFNHPAIKWPTTGGIAPTALLLAALEERFARFPDERQIPLRYWAEVGRYETELGVTPRTLLKFEAPEPHVVVFHEAAIGYQYTGDRKQLGAFQATEIPYWGTAAQMAAWYGADDGR